MKGRGGKGDQGKEAVRKRERENMGHQLCGGLVPSKGRPWDGGHSQRPVASPDR